MRARNWILGCSATAALVMSCVGAGCGGSSDNGSPAADAGQDVTADHTAPQPDAAADTAVDAPMMCMVDADLTHLGLDAGDAGGCVSCIQSHCQTAIGECNADCECKSAFLMFLGCTGAGGSLLTCAIQDLGGISNQMILTDFQTCAPACATTCGLSLDGGREGGDAASDAPADGG